MLLGGSGTKPFIPALQADATIDQANPVQNTWYTVLATTLNVELDQFSMQVADTGETLAVEWTVDGIVLTMNQAATAGSQYMVHKGANQDTLTITASATAQYGASSRYAPLKCRSLKIRVRKTTAAGVGNISARAMYHKW